ncbi:MAG TPA: thiazole synthase [Pirellulaceae bacterium]|nr:thiazole synthase [Pirellulaceae bacterium]HMO91043.1 thiazole synthase [Pirellulaceae bacterium]HMP68158.1 thiazole synthase [Pirellulaceae bacterium]
MREILSESELNQDLHTRDLPLLRIGSFELRSRLILGSGRYSSFEVMREALHASGAECVTVAVRREKLHDSDGRNILDYIDTNRYILLPNTAGCYDADTAVRCARMGREILLRLNNPGAKWVKLEVLGDNRTLLPDPVETLRATERLVRDGFQVLCYTSDDPIIAKKLKTAGAVAVMPAGSPIGSGLGIANPHNLQLILELLKNDDSEFPVVVDAGIGTASDVTIAMELGADAVLLNSAVAKATYPVLMAQAMRAASESGFLARMSQRMGKSRYGSASSPEHGQIAKWLVNESEQ